MADRPEVGTVKQIPKTKPRPATPGPTPVVPKDSAALAMDLVDLKAAIDLESVKWKKMMKELNEDIHADGTKVPQNLGSEQAVGPRITPRHKIKVRDSQSPDRLVEQSLRQDQLMVSLRNLKSQLDHIMEVKDEVKSPVFKWEPLVADLNGLIASSLRLVHDLPNSSVLAKGALDASD